MPWYDETGAGRGIIFFPATVQYLNLGILLGWNNAEGHCWLISSTLDTEIGPSKLLILQRGRSRIIIAIIIVLVADWAAS